MDTPYLGMVQYFGFSFTPKMYAQCNGALLNISQNSALFALLGTNYGGDGRTTFALPDLRGRAIVGWNNTNSLGEKMGAEGATLLTQNMPTHTHTATGKIAAFVDTRNGGNTNTPSAGTFPATPVNNQTMYTATPTANSVLAGVTVQVSNSGMGQPFSTLNPYLALNCCIATQGLFPPRN